MLPVGGALLGKPVIEPLSGRMARARGPGTRAEKLLPNVGGYQALLESKVLSHLSYNNVPVNLRTINNTIYELFVARY